MLERHPYEERVEEAERIHERAELLLAQQLKATGRLPKTCTLAEYELALTAAQAELEAEALAVGGVDIGAIRTSVGAREAVDRRVQVLLGAEGRSLADVDQDTYLELYAKAEAELYPEPAA